MTEPKVMDARPFDPVDRVRELSIALAESTRELSTLVGPVWHQREALRKEIKLRADMQEDSEERCDRLAAELRDRDAARIPCCVCERSMPEVFSVRVDRPEDPPLDEKHVCGECAKAASRHVFWRQIGAPEPKGPLTGWSPR